MDKSAFEGLSAREHGERLFRFVENIPPVLPREILADLAKKPQKGKSSEQWVELLAKKFMGSGGVINADCRMLCAGSLLGNRVPMTGQVIIDDFNEAPNAGGSTSVLVSLTATNLAVLRWAEGTFSEKERDDARALRRLAKSFSIEGLRGCLRRHHVLVPRPGRIEELPLIADGILNRHALQEALLDWLCQQLAIAADLKAAAKQRWILAGRPFLLRHAPYASFCLRVLLMLLAGMTHRVLSSRRTNLIDAEYLLYMPFCEVFVSGDRLHRQLVPMLLRDNQVFVEGADFKADLCEIADVRGRLGAEETARRRYAFGERPWPTSRGALWNVWETLRGPWEPPDETVRTNLSQDQRELAVREAQAMLAKAKPPPG